MYVGMNTPLISAQLYCYDGSQISQNQYQEKCMGIGKENFMFQVWERRRGHKKAAHILNLSAQ